MKKPNLKESLNMVTIGLMLIIGIGAFFGGMKYQQSKTPFNLNQFSGNPFGGRGQFGDRGGNNQAGGTRDGTGNQSGVGQRRMGNGQIVGEITSVADNSITVKMTDGSSKIVILGNNTKVSKSTEVQKSELKAGVKVAVFGTPNTDGSVTGSNIELDPALLGQMAKLTGTPTK